MEDPVFHPLMQILSHSGRFDFFHEFCHFFTCFLIFEDSFVGLKIANLLGEFPARDKKRNRLDKFLN